MDERNGLFSENPLMKKVSKIKQDLAYTSDEVVTYNGVFNKSLYFLALIIGGIAICLLMNTQGIVQQVVRDSKTHRVIVGGFTNYAMYGFFISTVMFMITPFIALFVRRTLAFWGGLYFIATGYILMFMVKALPEYQAPVLIALFLTIAVVLSMLAVYRSGKVQNMDTINKVVLVGLFSMIGISLFCFIASFIPGLNTIVSIMMANPIIYIGSAVLGVVIGSLMLLVDFDAIKNAVDYGCPKEYEWYLAYSIMFSVVWLYFRILELVLRIMQMANRDN